MRRGLKVVVEAHGATDPDLIGRDPAFEEVRQFLDVLQFHERERVGRAVAALDAELGQAAVGDVLEIFAHVMQVFPYDEALILEACFYGAGPNLIRDGFGWPASLDLNNCR